MKRTAWHDEEIGVGNVRRAPFYVKHWFTHTYAAVVHTDSHVWFVKTEMKRPDPATPPAARPGR